MARAINPYAGTYGPAGVPLGSKELKKALKSIKIKHPNKKLSENSYKQGLKKVSEEGS